MPAVRDSMDSSPATVHPETPVEELVARLDVLGARAA
jgi:CBS-domain-containing membrane protein